MCFAYQIRKEGTDIRALIAIIRAKKAIFAILAAVIVLGAATGGTLAWITVRSNTVQNTFTTAGVQITLSETDSDQDGNASVNNYVMSPGALLAKDPTVTVQAGSMPCYLLVQLNATENLGDFIAYELADGWTALDSAANVYYRLVGTSAEAQVFPVLRNNQVQVKSSVTNEMMRRLTPENYPALTFTAYAVQQEGVATAADAWAVFAE